MINQAVLEMARALVASGVSVVPIRPINPNNPRDGGKTPALNSWGQYQRRRATPEELNQWFRIDDIRGVAVIGGAVSGNLEVLDFDQPGAYEEWVKGCQDHDLLEIAKRCPVTKTPSGCYHVYYRCKSPTGARKILARKAKPDGKPTVVVESRGEGVYCVVAPSPRQVHPDNKPYVLISGRMNEMPVINANEREGLRAMASLLNTYIEPEKMAKVHHVLEGKLGIEGQPGRDYSAQPNVDDLIAEVLEKHRWRCTGRSVLRSDWLRPDHEQRHGRSATLGYGRPGVFHVFSSGTEHFAADESYSPFHVFATLEHRGDYRAAAAELAGNGYGDKKNKAERERSQKAALSASEPSIPLDPRISLTGEWQTPASLQDRGRLPRFPLTAVPGAVQSMIVEVSRVGQVPIDMAALAALMCAGAATRGRVRIKVANVFSVHTNMYGIVVALPSERKSEIRNYMAEPLIKLQTRMLAEAGPKKARAEAEWQNIENHIVGLENSLRRAKVTNEEREEKEAEIIKLKEERLPIPQMPQMITDDCNPTVLAMLTGNQEDNAMAVISAEGGIFETLMQDKKPDFDFLLKGFNQEYTIVNRVGRGTQEIPKPSLTLLLMVQPYIVENLVTNEAFRGKGLLSRFMFAYPEESPYRDFDEDAEISPVIQGQYEDIIRTLFAIPNPVTKEEPRNCHEISIAPKSAAMTVWKKFHNKVIARCKGQDGDLRPIADWAGKLSGQVARLAGLFHLLRYSNVYAAMDAPIGEEDMISAVRIGEYLIPHAVKTFDNKGGKNDIKVAEHLVAALRKREVACCVEFRELCAMLVGPKGSDIEAAVGVLERTGYLRVAPETSLLPVGKQEFLINPWMYERKELS